MELFSNLGYLDQFPLLKSRDYGVIKDQISHYLCPHQFSVLSDQALDTQLYGFSFGPLALYDLSYSAPVDISFGPTADFYLFRFNLEGRCQVEYAQHAYEQSPGVLTVSHPYTVNRIITNAECRNIILKIDRQALEAVLNKMLGYTASKAIKFNSGISCTSEGRSSILETLNYLCHAYSHIEQWWQVSDSFTQYLIELLLIKVPHNYSDQIHAEKFQLLPAYMKKAVRFIESSLMQSVQLSDIAVAAGVSIRTLQKGFNQYFNQAPLSYIRDQKLNRVHHELLNAQGQMTVTDVLCRYGIKSLGHFTAMYKKRFGCLPSDTLKASSKLYH